MRAIRYFRLSFLLPLLLPLLAAPFVRMGHGWLAGVAVFLWASLLIGGIPYIFFMAGVFYWMRNKDYRTVQRMTFIAPFIFGFVFVFGAVFILAPLQLLTLGQVRVEGSGVGLIFIFILIFGYFYVILTNAGFYLLKHLGFIVEEVEWERDYEGAWRGFKGR